MIEKMMMRLLFFTSGTSSLPKGCPHTSRNLWHATKPVFSTNKFSYLLVSPNFHFLGLFHLIHTWRAGGKVVIPSNRSDPQLILSAIEIERIIIMTAVPTALQALLDHLFLARYNLSSLTWIATGGSVVSLDILKGCTDSSGLGAKRAIGGYGMSEGSPTFYPVEGEQPALNEGCTSVGRITSMQSEDMWAWHKTNAMPWGGWGTAHWRVEDHLQSQRRHTSVGCQSANPIWKNYSVCQRICIDQTGARL